MAVDALMRKLTIPSKFIPYLEKHRIYELFYDVGNELAMSQPEDPLAFMKECLERLDQVRDKRLVVIMSSSHLDRIKLAHLISVLTGYGMLTRYIMCGKSGNHLDPVNLAVNTADHIRSSDKKGWLFVDYPANKEEAKMLIKHKVIPTHTFLLLDEDQTTHNEDDDEDSLKVKSVFRDCDTNMLQLREMFKSSLNVVNVKDRSLEDVASICAKLTTKMKPRHAPSLFRVALIGPKGSRRKTIAKLLQEKYNLVHVDIFHLINAARQLDNEIGDEIKRLEKFELPYSNKLILDLLTARLYKKDCLQRGYVLTNYPRSREDFVLLDSTKTPPNKVIFIDIEGAVCEKILEDRVVNMYTGQQYSKRMIHRNDLLKNQALTHPDNDPCVIEEDIKFYKKHIVDLMDYCGKTGFVIDGAGSIKSLFERVESVLMSPAPTVAARSGRMDEQRSSILKQSIQMRSIADSYPIPQTQQVVPLIDSEELIHRFEELKTNYLQQISSEDLVIHSKSSSGSHEIEKLQINRSQPIFSEFLERYSKSSSGSYEINKLQEEILDYSTETLRSDLGNSDAKLNYRSVEPGIHDEDNYGVYDERSQLVYEGNSCVCDEPLLLDEDPLLPD